MQDSVLNLCRVKLRDQQRLKHGPLTEYPNQTSATRCRARATPRAAASRARRCTARPGGANDYCYVIIQPQVWKPLARIAAAPNSPTIRPTPRPRPASSTSTKSSA